MPKYTFTALGSFKQSIQLSYLESHSPLIQGFVGSQSTACAVKFFDARVRLPLHTDGTYYLENWDYSVIQIGSTKSNFPTP